MKNGEDKGEKNVVPPFLQKDKHEHEKLLSIDDAIEMLGMGMFQVRILLAAGLCFAADAMEVLLLSFLSIVLHSIWDLTDNQTSMISSSVFAGALLGTLILGSLADCIGRKPVFIITVLIIALFGVLTAAANTYITLLVVRFIVGFGVGGLTVPYDTLAEFIPNFYRGRMMLSLKYFWTLGTTLVPIIAYFTLGKGAEQVGVEPGEENNYESWRLFVLLCALPCVKSTILAILFVPESPRFLVAKNKNAMAMDILRSAAKQNKKDPDRLYPKGIKLVDNTTGGTRMGVSDLFSEKWRFTTMSIWIVWISFALLYYGTILIITRVFSSSITLSAAAAAEENIDIISIDPKNLYDFDYAAICFSAFSEFIGISFVIYFIDRAGRIPIQATSYAFAGMSIAALCVLAESERTSRTLLLLIAFLARMFASCAASVTWLSTSEIFPTEIRTTGHSTANAIARIGGIIAPFLVSGSISFGLIGMILLLVGIVASLCSSCLPETVGAPLGYMQNDTPVRVSTSFWENPSLANKHVDKSTWV